MKKINIIDIIIVLVIVAAVAAAMLMKIDDSTAIVAQGKKIVVLELTEKHVGFSENVIIGDKVTEKVEKKEIGTVTGVETKPCERNSYNYITGKAVVADIPERENVYVTIGVDKSANVAVGKQLSVITKHFSGSGYVVGVSDAE